VIDEPAGENRCVRLTRAEAKLGENESLTTDEAPAAFGETDILITEEAAASVWRDNVSSAIDEACIDTVPAFVDSGKFVFLVSISSSTSRT